MAGTPFSKRNHSKQVRQSTWEVADESQTPKAHEIQFAGETNGKACRQESGQRFPIVAFPSRRRQIVAEGSSDGQPLLPLPRKRAFGAAGERGVFHRWGWRVGGRVGSLHGTAQASAGRFGPGLRAGPTSRSDA